MKDQDMTAYTLSKKTGISQAAIGQWLNGKKFINFTKILKTKLNFKNGKKLKGQK